MPNNNFFANLGARYIQAGYRVIPITPNDKMPMGTGWQNLRLTLEEHAKRAANGAASAGLGILTGVAGADSPDAAPYLMDGDTRNAQVAVGMRAWADKQLGIAPERVGEAPKFGLVFRAPPGAAKLQSAVFYDPGHEGEKAHAHRLEWLGAGQQFVAHGIHPVTGKPYQHGGMFGSLLELELDELPAVTHEQKQAAIVEFERLCRASGLAAAGSTPQPREVSTDDFGSDLDWLDKPNVSLAQVVEALALLTAEVDDYDTWLRVGMACHHQGHGAEDELAWMDAWNDWSSNGSEYAGYEDIEARWKSFSATKGNGSRPTTVATILGLAKQAKAVKKYDAVDNYKALVAAATSEQDLRDNVCRAIAKDATLDAIGREVLVQAVQAQLKVLNGGVKLAVGMVRGLLRPATLREVVTPDAPRWATPWVWSTEDDAFFNTVSKETYTKISFDAAYTRNIVVLNEEGETVKAKASDVALDTWALDIVSGVRYLPGCDDRLAMDGRHYANSYRTDGIPAVPAVLSDDDRLAVRAMERHLELLVPVAAHRAMLVQALAWIVRNPGQKLQWAPLIKGVEGDGKSVLARLLAAVMGQSNVRILSPETLTTSGFTGWTEGNCVVVIEELMVQGHNRFEVVNKLKPIITNEVIEVHPKHKNPYTAPNTSNMMAFTNHEDALPLSDTDRRYFVLFSPWTKIEEMWATIRREHNMDMQTYWNELWDGIKNNAGALRGWLEAVDLSTFDQYARAPDTDFKRAMVVDEISDMDMAIDDLLSAGEFGTGASGIVLGAMLSQAVEERTGDKPQSRRLNRAMVARGYRVHRAGTGKYAGKSYRVYVTEDWRDKPIGEVMAQVRVLGEAMGDAFAGMGVTANG